MIRGVKFSPSFMHESRRVRRALCTKVQTLGSGPLTKTSLSGTLSPLFLDDDFIHYAPLLEGDSAVRSSDQA